MNFILNYTGDTRFFIYVARTSPSANSQTLIYRKLVYSRLAQQVEDAPWSKLRTTLFYPVLFLYQLLFKKSGVSCYAFKFL